MRDRAKCVFVVILQNERLCYKYGVNRNDVDVDKILTPFQIFLSMICNPDFYKSNITILKNDTDIGFITCDQPIINLYHDYKANNITDKTKYYYPVSPKIAIIINGEKDLEVENIVDIEYIKSLNYKIWNDHDKFVFGNRKELLENVYC